jgi:hypothetical protein
MKEKKTVGSPLFRAFPCDCIPKAKKDVNIYFFIPVAVPVNYSSEFRQLFEATTYIQLSVCFLHITLCPSFTS